MIVRSRIEAALSRIRASRRRNFFRTRWGYVLWAEGDPGSAVWLPSPSPIRDLLIALGFSLRLRRACRLRPVPEGCDPVREARRAEAAADRMLRR